MYRYSDLQQLKKDIVQICRVKVLLTKI